MSCAGPTTCTRTRRSRCSARSTISSIWSGTIAATAAWQALEHVCAEIATETERFLTAEAELLAAYPQLSWMLTPYLDGMRSWMRGNLDWSRQTPRYNPADVSQYEEPEEYLEATVLGVVRD